MRFLPLILGSLRRRTPRTLFTLFSIAVAFLLYGLLAAVKNSFDGNVALAGADRLVTMHKISLVQPLPVSYQERIASIPGVTLVTHSDWFGGHYQNDPNVIITYAVPPESYLAMYPEYLLPSKEREHWLHDRVGMVVGRGLAETYGWKVGDRVPIRSDIYARKDGNYTWEFVLDGIYDNKDPSGDVTTILFNYDYFDESRTANKGMVSYYIERIDDPQRAPQIATAIDARFTNSSAETKSGTEKAFIQGFANQTGDIGAIATSIGIAVFFTMLLVSANTMAQSVRERIGELAVLKTLGFGDGQVLGLVISESLLLTLLGGALGLLAALFVVSRIGRSLAQFLGTFLVTPGALAVGALLILALGIAAGALPAVRASRLKIADALAQR
jgi:putative ABC transport system permease protein